MRIGVMSDSHGCAERIERAVRQMGRVDRIIHLGDYSGDCRTVEKWAGCPVFPLRGNCDRGSRAPDEMLFQADGIRIYCCHGHLFRVKSGIDALAAKAAMEGAQVALYGHTHRASVDRLYGVILLNPGALCLSAREPGYALLHIGQKIDPILHKLT